ncbi:hypothetical protein SBV1_3560002 [Verrucomicrobia bacterium]|nr:hypothetical protein SBV1_3560002 [Verrucomicrobiota bacterium]
MKGEVAGGSSLANLHSAVTAHLCPVRGENAPRCPPPGSIPPKTGRFLPNLSCQFFSKPLDMRGEIWDFHDGIRFVGKLCLGMLVMPSPCAVERTVASRSRTQYKCLVENMSFYELESSGLGPFSPVSRRQTRRVCSPFEARLYFD